LQSSGALNCVQFILVRSVQKYCDTVNVRMSWRRLLQLHFA